MYLSNSWFVNLHYSHNLFQFTLYKGDSLFINSPFFNLPFRRMIHLSFTFFQFTPLNDSPFSRVIHPLWGYMRSPFLKDETYLRNYIEKLYHPSKRVNWVNHTSKGEWRFTKYTLANNLNVNKNKFFERKTSKVCYRPSASPFLFICHHILSIWAINK